MAETRSMLVRTSIKDSQPVFLAPTNVDEPKKEFLEFFGRKVARDMDGRVFAGSSDESEKRLGSCALCGHRGLVIKSDPCRRQCGHSARLPVDAWPVTWVRMLDHGAAQAPDCHAASGLDADHLRHERRGRCSG